MSVNVYQDTMTIPIVRCPEIVINSTISGYSSMEDQQDQDNNFKSDFAKQLELKLVSPAGKSEETPDYSQLYQQTEELRRAKEEFMRIKQENIRLKSEIDKQRVDEERYHKLQYEVEHLTNRLHKMEENRAAYEDLTEQLGSYINIFSSQLSLSDVRDLSKSCSLPKPISLYPESSTLPRQMYHHEFSSSTLPRQMYHQESLPSRKTYYEENSKSLGRQRQRPVVQIQESSLDSASDGEYRDKGFLSLPRNNRTGGKHQQNLRLRSRTMTNPRKKRTTHFEDEDVSKTIEISNDIGIKKKKGFEVFLTKLKMFVLKRSKYDMQVQTLV